MYFYFNIKKQKNLYFYGYRYIIEQYYIKFYDLLVYLHVQYYISHNIVAIVFNV